MPYGTSARVALVNSSGQTITNATGVTQYNLTAYSDLNTDSGYFVAQYNREAPMTTGKDFVWGNFPSGTGHVVGSLLTINNTTVDGVLEGDERILSIHRPTTLRSMEPELKMSLMADFISAKAFSTYLSTARR
jgi:hypothetical protein